MVDDGRRFGGGDRRPDLPGLLDQCERAVDGARRARHGARDRFDRGHLAQRGSRHRRDRRHARRVRARSLRARCPSFGLPTVSSMSTSWCSTRTAR